MVKDKSILVFKAGEFYSFLQIAFIGVTNLSHFVLSPCIRLLLCKALWVHLSLKSSLEMKSWSCSFSPQSGHQKVTQHRGMKTQHGSAATYGLIFKYVVCVGALPGFSVNLFDVLFGWKRLILEK